MKKADLQALYREVKRRRRTRKTIINPTKHKSGCKSCGKTTWKPSKS
ncbi:hypothetical protein [Pseudalkalibacillus hwajinpoensis]|nr:hypothetical protein [Pseudalkalibacillus hwajinpoensis]